MVNISTPFLVMAGFLIITVFVILIIWLLKERNDRLLLSEAQLQLSNQLEIKEAELKVAQDTCAGLDKKLAIVSGNYQNLQEQHEQYKTDQRGIEERFENLANRVLNAKSAQFDEQQRKGLGDLLTPLSERIKAFEEKVMTTNREAIARDSALKENIRNLMQMSDRMREETTNLTRALKGDTQKQGAWGEVVLERVLEMSGLEKGREYIIQDTRTNADNRTVRPDVTLYMPDGKHLVIDSKVSLKHYEQAVNAESPETQANFLKQHLGSLRKHVDSLAGKNYHDLYQSAPDFVLMFVPIEPAFAAALREDSQLYDYGFCKNIVIVTPATLLATLKTVESLWRNEKQQANAVEIATEAGRMYDKLAGFCDDFQKIGKRLRQTDELYQNALGRLSTGKGNLISKAEKLKAMGAKANKALPAVLVQASEENTIMIKE